MRGNPFHELYAGETASDSAFVDLFSPSLLPFVSALYRPGNVALVGSQGNGKSMLLTLLKPEIRLAYASRGEEFPLRGVYGSFIGAGINIARSPARDFGQRLGDTRVTNQLPLLFGDFLNYWITQDILSSVVKLGGDAENGVSRQLGISATSDKLDAFAVSLADDESWFGYLSGVSSFDSLLLKVRQRLRTYKEFINLNIDELPPEISRSVTSVGTCVTSTTQKLRDFDVIGRETNVFVRIDQVDSLLDLADADRRYAGRFVEFRHVINKFLGSRDAVVSYRVGVRPYAWGAEMQIYGTSARLELNRDYIVVNLDTLLRRPENSKTWVFPSFAEDMFRRRLKLANYSPTGTRNLLGFVFGSEIRPKERAERYVRKGSSRLIGSIMGASSELISDLSKLATEDPFTAKMVEAWMRQKHAAAVNGNLENLLREIKSKQYWQKERVQLALLQIAARQQQRVVWSGKNDLVQLSGYNTLSILRLYRSIWDAWLQEEHDSATLESSRTPRNIAVEVQSAGILLASEEFHEKLGQETGSGILMRLADVLAAHFRRELLGDLAMSNPGHNGISLSSDDLNRDPVVKRIVEDACDFGVMTKHRHTTKNKDRKLRDKFYLNSLLSPYYQIPANHTKEPEYVSFEQLVSWIREAQLLPDDYQPTYSVRKGSRLGNQPSFEGLMDV